jgi:hypothetical protein
MSPSTKRPYERPTLQGKEMFGAEGTTGSCCKTTISTCSTATKSGLGKSVRTSTTS